MYKSIALSGTAASGTSTAAKTLAEKLKLTRHNAGDFFRQYTQEKNIPLQSHMQIPDEVDREVDEKFAVLAETGGVVLEGRYIGYFTRNMDDVLRVLLEADEEVRIRRAHERTNVPQESAGDIRKREKENDEKFRKLYADENCLDPKFFNLVIDTTNKSKEAVAQEIIDEFEGK